MVKIQSPALFQTSLHFSCRRREVVSPQPQPARVLDAVLEAINKDPRFRPTVFKKLTGVYFEKTAPAMEFLVQAIKTEVAKVPREFKVLDSMLERLAKIAPQNQFPVLFEMLVMVQGKIIEAREEEKTSIPLERLSSHLEEKLRLLAPDQKTFERLKATPFQTTQQMQEAATKAKEAALPTWKRTALGAACTVLGALIGAGAASIYLAGMRPEAIPVFDPPAAPPVPQAEGTHWMTNGMGLAAAGFSLNAIRLARKKEAPVTPADAPVAATPTDPSAPAATSGLSVQDLKELAEGGIAQTDALVNRAELLQRRMAAVTASSLSSAAAISSALPLGGPAIKVDPNLADDREESPPGSPPPVSPRRRVQTAAGADDEKVTRQPAPLALPAPATGASSSGGAPSSWWSWGTSS